MTHFNSLIQASAYQFTLLCISICDENGAINFGFRSIVFVLLTGLITLGGAFLVSILPRKSSVEVYLSIFLVVGSAFGTILMGYLHFVMGQNDILGFASLMNSLITEIINDIAELRKELQELRKKLHQPQAQPSA